MLLESAFVSAQVIKGNCTKIKIVQNQLIFQQGTKVVVHSLVLSKDFNGTAETTLSMLGRRLTR